MGLFWELKKEETWKRIQKKQIKREFAKPGLNDNKELLVVNKNHKPVFYLKTYPYESAWEYFETGRLVCCFENDGRKEIFKEEARCTGDYQFSSTSFGSEKEVLELISGLPANLYAVNVDEYEEFVNSDGAMSIDFRGRILHTGDKVEIEKYSETEGGISPEYDHLDGTVVYRFRDDDFFILLYKPPHEHKIIHNGIHLATAYYEKRELPLRRCKIA